MSEFTTSTPIVLQLPPLNQLRRLTAVPPPSYDWIETLQHYITTVAAHLCKLQSIINLKPYPTIGALWQINCDPGKLDPIHLLLSETPYPSNLTAWFDTARNLTDRVDYAIRIFDSHVTTLRCSAYESSPWKKALTCARRTIDQAYQYNDQLYQHMLDLTRMLEDRATDTPYQATIIPFPRQMQPV